MMKKTGSRVLQAVAIALPIAVAGGLFAQASSSMADARPVVATAAAAQSSAAHVYLIDCSHRPEVRPASFDIACGGDDAALAHVHWSSWSARSAHGAGRFTINTCTPNCAAAHTESYAVEVTASNPTGRAGGGRYRTLELVFPHAQPEGVHDHRSTIDLDSLRGL